ncbi:hypothetical protein EWW49_30270, partial [Pseudomonas syringae]
ALLAGRPGCGGECRRRGLDGRREGRQAGAQRQWTRGPAGECQGGEEAGRKSGWNRSHGRFINLGKTYHGKQGTEEALGNIDLATHRGENFDKNDKTKQQPQSTTRQKKRQEKKKRKKKKKEKEKRKEGRRWKGREKG